MINHFILTRFNLPTPGKELRRRFEEKWLEDRFDLFRRFCLPSVASQGSRDFQWIIYFDEETPQEFKAEVEKLRSVFPFEPFYTGLFNASGWYKSIEETFAPKSELILTTRLDNDDAISSNFVARLREAVDARQRSLGAYNFKQGLIRRGGSVYDYSNPSNAFLSLLERNCAAARTAYGIQHMKVADVHDTFQIDGEPAWMQIIHQRNVSNRVRGRRLNNPTSIGLFFGESGVPVSQEDIVGSLFDRFLLYPLRLAMDEAIRIARVLKLK